MGLRDYPLCQNGSWVDGVSTALPFLESGAVRGLRWLPEDEPVADTAESDARAPVQLIGRGTAVWSPAMCAPLACRMVCVVACRPGPRAHC